MRVATLGCEVPRKREKAVQRAAELLRRGGLVIFPTETVYGIAACATSDRGLERLREIKGRPEDQPFTVHLPDADSIELYLEPRTRPLLMRLARKTMPGPITLLAEVEDAVIERKLSELGIGLRHRGRLYHGNTIGLRCPDHAVSAALLAAVGRPVVASSANVTGRPAPIDADQAARSLGGRADLILDGGPCRYAKASTIARVRGGRVEVVREGVYDQRYLEKLLRRLVLFVCSGNTCRSPMAEAIARQELRQAAGPPKADGEGAATDIDVTSAGAFAMPGAAVSPEAAHALRRLGVPLESHTARTLSLAMLQQADVIFCMTETHRQAVAEMLPSAGAKALLLDPDGGAIEDPVGAGVEVYVECAKRLQQLIRRRLEELDAGRQNNGDARLCGSSLRE